MLKLSEKDPFVHTKTKVYRYSELNERPDEESILKQSVISTSSANFKEITNSFSGKIQEKQQMKPLFLFLASSLNTEIVYVILKSIT